MLLRFGSALVFEDHSAVGVLRALVRILATDKNKTNRSHVVHIGRGHCAAHAAATTFGIGEAVPVDTAGLEPAHQHAARPVGCGGSRSRGRRHYTSELLIFGDFNIQFYDVQLQSWVFARFFSRPPPGPQQNAGAVRVSGCDSLRKKITTFTPCDAGLRSKWTAPRCRRAHRGGHLEERSSGDTGHRSSPWRNI